MLLGWSALYVARTSFDAGDGRIFCLWDDAMISMTYARNLAEGHGLVWNVGEPPVQGFTNLGVTLLMALLHLLPLSDRFMALAWQAACVACLLGVAHLTWRGGRRWLSRPARWAVWPAMLAAAPLTVWTLQGSDVGPAALWLTAVFGSVTGAARMSRAAQAALFAVGPVLRPDMALFCGICGVFAASQAARGERLQTLARLGAASAAGLGASVLVSWWQVGDPLPNTYYLKTKGFPPGLRLTAGWLQLQRNGLVTATILAACALGAWSRRQHPAAWLALALVLAAHAYNVWTGGDWAEDWGSRFTCPTAPMHALLACAAAAWVVQRAAPRSERRAPAAVTLAVVLVFLANPSRAVVDWFVPTAAPMYRNDNLRNYAKARLVAAHMPPSTSLAVHWVGVPPYFTRLPAVDVLGKSDRHIARMSVRRFIPGHSKWDWTYVVQQRQPDVFLRQSRGLLARKDFRERYVAVEAPGDITFFARRDKVGALQLRPVRIADLRTNTYVPIARFSRGAGVARPPGTARPASRGAPLRSRDPDP